MNEATDLDTTCINTIRTLAMDAVQAATRQALPTIDRSKYASAAALARGAYVLADPAEGKPDVSLLASGSEVALCLEAHRQKDLVKKFGFTPEHVVAAAREQLGLPSR